MQNAEWGEHMNLSKEKLKKAALVALTIALAAVEFGLKADRYSKSGNIFTVFILLSIFTLLRDLKRAAKSEQQPEQQKSDAPTPFTDTSVSALGGLDWMLHKINPGYDPDAERNARNTDPDAIRKLDDMKAAGLIDEKEYRDRKAKLGEK